MKHLHFDLRHVERTDELEVRIGSARYPLNAHSTQSLESASANQGVLALLPREHQQRFSHFAVVDKTHFTAGDVRYLQVVIPERDGVHLPQVVAMSLILPEDYLRAFWKNRLERFQQPIEQLRTYCRHTIRRKPRIHCARLVHLGVSSLPDEPAAQLDALVQSQTLATPLDTAAALVSWHPNLASIQPGTMAQVLNEHILPIPELHPQQYNNMQLLAAQISSIGTDWSPIVPCKDGNGNPLHAEYTIPGHIDAGEALHTYGLHEDLDGHLATCLAGANRSASNDVQLMAQTWSANNGSTFAASEVAAGESASRCDSESAEARFKWTVNERTVHHGVLVHADSIDLDRDSQLSIDVSNSYLRTLIAGYQLLGAGGQPLGTKVRLRSVSASNNILGIPVPTDPATLTIPMGNAAGVRLYFASLGVSDWDDDFSLSGSLLTGLWQYGVPGLLLAGGTYITNHREFNRIVNDPELFATALAIGLPMVGGGVATASAVFNTKKVLFLFADFVVGLILQKGMEKLGRWIAEKAVTGTLGSLLGPVGWIFRTAATLIGIEEMAVTTGEVLSSPSCIKVTVSRAIDVTVTLCPDPAHGEAGNPRSAVWPAVATNYVAYLEYQGGTNRKITGEMPAITSGSPMPFRFDDVPAGGSFRVIFGLYSDNGWLAGSWESEWMTAQTSDGSTTLALGEHSIAEQLVPLSPDTQYLFKERIAVAGGRYVWQAGPPPLATQASLACGVEGTLCELVGITLNNSAYQVGYAWRASGQQLPTNSASAAKSDAQQYVLQNLSVLADPQSRLIVSDIGLSNRPGIAYASAPNPHKQIDQNNFILDPRDSVMHLRKVNLGGAPNFGLGEHDGQSWGQFPLNTLDALVIHPDGIALAASWKDSKLMLLPLPAQGSPDSEAPMAMMVSGEGVRQGLLLGPKALAVMPDGRILVLESENNRVQAFDTKGNAVPGFTPKGPLLSIATAGIAAALNDGAVPESLIQALIDQRDGFLCTLDDHHVAQLDQARFFAENDPLIEALGRNRLALAYDPQAMDDPALSAQIRVIEAGHEWLISDPRGSTWQVRLGSGGLAVYQRPCRARVEVIAPGSEWHIVDGTTNQAWRVRPSTASPEQSLVFHSQSWFPLRGTRRVPQVYLDMAVEAQGYIYVLSHTGDGSRASDYLLDIHAPDGSFLSRSPDPSLTRTPQNLVAAKLAVSLWRDVYGLMFETLKSPAGTIQPGIGHWVPTPPLFQMSVDQQPRLNERNIGEVQLEFARHAIGLSKSAYIEVIDANGIWNIKDGSTTYHVYRVANAIYVYAVPA